MNGESGSLGSTRLDDSRYQIRRQIGSGGAAEVFLALDKVLGRTVALKVLDRRLASDRGFVRRFEREAHLAASFSHPNIVTVYDLGETTDGAPYIAMELVSGGTLKNLVDEESRLSPRRAAEIALAIAHALEEAHRHGLIHRDIKPQNVLLTEEGRAKVADFGVAKAVEGTSLTEPGMLVGTVHYLSPEQAAGENITPSSDLYSLGVVLYEMISGSRPFEADSWEEGPMAVVNKRLTQDPPPLEDRAPDAPSWLVEVTMRLLSRAPEQRFPNATELADALERGLGEKRNAPATTAVAGAPEQRHDPPANPTPEEDHPQLISSPAASSPPTVKHWRRRRTDKALFFTLIILLAASALYSIVRQTVIVPDLSGQTLEQAKTSTKEDLQLVVSSRRGGSSDGEILSTNPQAGTRVLRGSKVSVVIGVPRGTNGQRSTKGEGGTTSLNPSVSPSSIYPPPNPPEPASPPNDQYR